MPKDSIAGAGKELDKADFLRALRTIIGRFSLETFFYLPLAGSMQFLVDDSHHFTIDAVIMEHKDRWDNTEDFKGYDVYERGETYLSHLAVDSLLSCALESKVLIRYGHYDDFEDVPGQVYLMMVLNLCNASADHDIEAATITCGKLSLAEYPGENVEHFATEALRLIKIMQGGCALPYMLGTDLLVKVKGTAFEYFNRKVFQFMDDVRTMEDKVGASRNPILMTKDPKYKEYALLQKSYGDATKRPGEWPALASQIPQANLADHRDDRSSGPPSTIDTRTGTGPAPASSKGTSIIPKGDDTPSPFAHLDPGWCFKQPANEEAPMVIGDATYYFCRHCKCRKTYKVGLYNKTHSTSKNGGLKRGDLTKEEQDKSYPVDPNLGKTSVPVTQPAAGPAANSPLPSTMASDAAHVDTDPDGLHFSESAFLAEVIDNVDCGVWMAATPDSEGD